jgi:CBS domain-containing protein
VDPKLYVKEVMVQEVIKIRADATVIEAVEIINKHEIGCLIVTKNGETIGIMTERDVLKRVIPKSKNPEKTKVSEIMSTPLIVGGPDMYIEDAARLMFKKNIKKLPIMENGKLVGLLTLSDVARVVHIQSLVKVIRELSEKGWLPPKRMKKVIDIYI